MSQYIKQRPQFTAPGRSALSDCGSQCALKHFASEVVAIKVSTSKFEASGFMQIGHLGLEVSTLAKVGVRWSTRLTNELLLHQ